METHVRQFMVNKTLFNNIFIIILTMLNLYFIGIGIMFLLPQWILAYIYQSFIVFVYVAFVVEDMDRNSFANRNSQWILLGINVGYIIMGVVIDCILFPHYVLQYNFELASDLLIFAWIYTGVYILGAGVLSVLAAITIVRKWKVYSGSRKIVKKLFWALVFLSVWIVVAGILTIIQATVPEQLWDVYEYCRSQSFFIFRILETVAVFILLILVFVTGRKKTKHGTSSGSTKKNTSGSKDVELESMEHTEDNNSSDAHSSIE